MRLSDKCWRLGRNNGIYETTVSECTRGDCTCDEFFVTEKDAWLAELCRAESDLQMREREVNNAKARINATRRRIGECGK
jgi:hypothetical protein